ncbi:MAG: hypothetical protein PHC64_01080 [Candidatus Gastranaerophilales bacterium]|nr:hypothetical protein [Candidatus Gastranaerophilales bacterium]
MKKIFSISVICAVLATGQVLACGQKESGTITGGACSVSELMNLEKNKIVLAKKDTLERNLRPVRPQIFMKNAGNDCLFGICPYKNILKELK